MLHDTIASPSGLVAVNRLRGLGLEEERPVAADATRRTRRRLRTVDHPRRLALMKILIIEDETMDVHLIVSALEECGLDCDVSVARDGVEALDCLLREEANGKIPDLILLDLNLPKIDGHQVLRDIRSDRAFASIPVMVVSSSKSVDDVERSRRHGVLDYVVKPETLDDVDCLVKALRKFANEAK